MACRGIYLIIDDAQREAILTGANSAARRDLVNALEAELLPGPLALELDLAWEAMHRCLTDGTLRDGEGPLSLFVLGGDRVDVGRAHIARIVSPTQARAATDASHDVTQSQFRNAYFALRARVDYAINETDFQYTWSAFLDARDFFPRAAAMNRWVLFTAWG